MRKNTINKDQNEVVKVQTQRKSFFILASAGSQRPGNAFTLIPKKARPDNAGYPVKVEESCLTPLFSSSASGVLPA
jgi:hypothetical protein